MIFGAKSLAYSFYFLIAHLVADLLGLRKQFFWILHIVYLLAYLEYLGVEQKLNFGSFTENIIRIWK